MATTPEALREAREWLERAKRDLQAARNELEAEPALPEMTAYHAQQAGEKALKAFLTAHAVTFPFTHDLTTLLRICETVDAAFGAHVSAASTLTPYATLFRYPGGPLAPSDTEAKEALEFARGILLFVVEKLAA